MKVESRGTPLVYRLLASTCAMLMTLQLPACAWDAPVLQASEGDDLSNERLASTPAEAMSALEAEIAAKRARLGEFEDEALRGAAEEELATHEELLEMLPPEGRDKAEELATERLDRPDAEVLAEEIRDKADELETRASGEVGTMPGSLSVDDGGGAHYSIPLPLPPGRRGMHPGLGLSYSSHGGDGMVGMGWSLSMPATIQLCDAFMAVPAERTADMWNRDILVPEAKDRLCLGGNPLVAYDRVDGDYGWKEVLYSLPGAELRTVGDNFAKVVRPRWNGPAEPPDTPGEGLDETDPGFQVWAKDGQIHYYRYAPNQYGGVAWVLDYTVDRWGNRIDYEFDDDSRTPTAIRYLDGTRVVTFAYTDHPMPRVLRGTGGPVALDRLVDAIDVTIRGDLVTRYDLDYDYGRQTGRARLRSVKRCDGDNDCLPPTTFAYADRAVGASNYVNVSATDLVIDPHLAMSAQPGHLPPTRVEPRIQIMDLNGDGRDDISWREWDGWKYVLSSPDPEVVWSSVYSFSNSDWGVKAAFSIDGGRGLDEQAVLVLTDDERLMRLRLGPSEDDSARDLLPASHPGFLTGEVLDVNGDGFLDFVGCMRDDDFDLYDHEAFPEEMLHGDAGRWAVELGPVLDGGFTEERVSEVFCTPHGLQKRVVDGRMEVPRWQRELGTDNLRWTLQHAGRQLLEYSYADDDLGKTSPRLRHFTNGAWSAGPCGMVQGSAWSCPDDDDIDDPMFDPYRGSVAKDKRPSGDFNGDGLRDKMSVVDGEWVMFPQYWPGRPANGTGEGFGAYGRVELGDLDTPRNPE